MKGLTDAQAKQFIDIVANPANWPVLVDCKGGEGSAGVMSALVRHSFDSWQHDMVVKEAGNFRTRHLGFITKPMARCRQNFIQHWESSTGEVALLQELQAPKTAS